MSQEIIFENNFVGQVYFYKGMSYCPHNENSTLQSDLRQVETVILSCHFFYLLLLNPGGIFFNDVGFCLILISFEFCNNPKWFQKVFSLFNDFCFSKKLITPYRNNTSLISVFTFCYLLLIFDHKCSSFLIYFFLSQFVGYF